MAETPNHPGLPMRELDGPLTRAREVARQHNASAPDGGTGPGHHLTFSEGLRWYMNSVEMAMSPGAYLARHMVRNWPRYRHVLAALALSGEPARALMIAETGSTLEAVLDGLLPGLLDIAKWVGLGAVIGGGIGALGGPADEITVPGGALAGAEIGLWIANSLGLAGLLVGMVKNLEQFVVYATDAAEIAWYAGDDPRVPVHTDEVTASKLFAAAIAELWMALLTALVFEVMKRAAEAAHGQLREGAPTREALNDVTKKISDSKLGEKSGEWFRNNFDKIREAVRKHQEERQRQLDRRSDSGTAAETTERTEDSATNESGDPETSRKPQSLRDQYLGRTPGKNSRTGLEVQERMRADGTLRDGSEGTEFRASDGEWYPLKDADMAHKTDAVTWWNETGRQYGARSPEVRQWMLDPNNYTLDHYSINRSLGAQLPYRYLPPLK